MKRGADLIDFDRVTNVTASTALKSSEKVT